jgi:hypothetical protein
MIARIAPAPVESITPARKIEGLTRGKQPLVKTLDSLIWGQQSSGFNPVARSAVMANKPDQPASVKFVDQPHASIIFFDGAPVFTSYNGIIGITLSVNVGVPDGQGGIDGGQVVAAYLRGNIKALMALKVAVESALLLGAKTEGEAN